MAEFRLAIGAWILVAQAAANLKIAFATSHHQDLLEQLRALWKRVPVAGVQARWHQKIARTFGRALDQKRCFNFRETLAGKILARVLQNAVALAQNLLHGRTAQIQVAILQANFFVDLWRVVVIGKNWQINRLVEDLNLRGKKFNFAGGKF